MIDQSFTLCGNLTRDIEMSKDGVPRAKFRLAHNSRRLDSVSGEWKDGDTLFMDVVCWRTLATNVGTALGKGDPVVVVGRLRENTWLDRDNVSHSKFEIEADVVAVDLRRHVTTRVQKVARPAAEATAFQTAEAAGDGFAGTEGFAASGTDGFAASATDEAGDLQRVDDLVGAGAEPPF